MMIKRGIRAGIIFVSMVILVCLCVDTGVEAPDYAFNSPFSGIFAQNVPHTVDIVGIRQLEASRVALEAPKTPQIGTLDPEVDTCMDEKMDILNGEYELLGLLCLAEAENQSILGKKLVIDTVLNRVDSEKWPNSITEVIFQDNPKQFTSMWNGRIDRVELTEEVYELVLAELASRTDSEVLYFNTGEYATWATPVRKEGDHYFCK